MYKNNGIKTKRICFLTYLANEKIQSNNILRNNISSTIHFKFPPLCIMLNLLHREFKTFSLILPYFYTLLKLLLHYLSIFKKPLCDHVRTTECAVAKKAENGRGVECRVGGSKKNYSLKSSVV